MKHVLIVGDSQAAGPVGQQLEEELQRRGVIVEREGISGHGPADWVRLHWDAYARHLRDFQPTDVILIFGSNDPPNAELAAALRRFRDSTSADVWYSGPPQYPSLPDRQARSAAIREMAAEVFGRRYIDAWPFTGTFATRGRDGVHFTPDGARPWALGILTVWGTRRAAPFVWLAAAAGAAVGLWWWLRR